MLMRFESHQLVLYASKFWYFHVKGEVEHNAEIQEALFSLFESSGHIESLLELHGMDHRLFVARNVQTSDLSLVLAVSSAAFSMETSLLHFTARYGMPVICEKILLGSSARSAARRSLRRKTTIENIGERTRTGNDDDNDDGIGWISSRNRYGHVTASLGGLGRPRKYC